jgi:hypothetical protein
MKKHENKEEGEEQRKEPKMHLVRPVHAQNADPESTKIGEVGHPIMPEGLVNEVWFILNLVKVYRYWDDDEDSQYPRNPDALEFPREKLPNALSGQGRKGKIPGQEEKGRHHVYVEQLPNHVRYGRASIMDGPMGRHRAVCSHCMIENHRQHSQVAYRIKEQYMLIGWSFKSFRLTGSVHLSLLIIPIVSTIITCNVVADTT